MWTRGTSLLQLAEHARARQRGSVPQQERARYRGPADAIRVGMPRAPLSDVYYVLVAGSWKRLVGALVGFYLLANLGFAALYSLERGGIANAHDDFVEAFFFSVQTISTIGYGTMTPQTPLAHLLVTAESMVGLLGFAIATGLMFTKFARPSARVMFSQPMVMTRRHGKPALMFRVANARGNEVVEAAIRVAMLKTEKTPEGHQMRRLVDLKLVRDTSPLFALSWLVIHEIDEDSPLHGMDPEALDRDFSVFIVTMTGMDATFAQSVHARHLYDYRDIAWGHRFIDVIENRPDGRIVIDYRRFHDTEPEPAWRWGEERSATQEPSP